MARLRHIAIHVEEPKPGGFAGVLGERSAHAWQELDRADALAASYHQAMADGLLALQDLVPDLDVGPRSMDDAPSPREQAGSPRKKNGQASAASSSKSYFGFGPAR
jgi:hypothetical protein